MNKKQCFIKTSDKRVYEELLSNGYTLIANDKTSWTFLNDKAVENLPFSKDGKFFYTNKLNI